MNRSSIVRRWREESRTMNKPFTLDASKQYITVILSAFRYNYCIQPLDVISIAMRCAVCLNCYSLLASAAVSWDLISSYRPRKKMVNLLENGRYVPFAASRLYPGYVTWLLFAWQRSNSGGTWRGLSDPTFSSVVSFGHALPIPNRITSLRRSFP